MLNTESVYKGLRFLLLLAALVPLAGLADNESGVTLQFQPDRCVAVNEGQTCYQSIQVSWQANSAHQLCLHIDAQAKPLHCWPTGTQGKTRIEFASTESVTYQLRSQAASANSDTPDSETLAETRVVVTWVYGKTKRRRSSWRLF